MQLLWIAVDKRRRPATKKALRKRVWALLERRGVGRFPLPLTDRIPNFAGAIPMTTHDVPVDLVVTPTRVIPCRRTFTRPARIEWDALTPQQLAAMPVLARLRDAAART